MIITEAKRVQQVSEYYFSGKLKEINELRQQGKDIINLGIGSPDLSPLAEAIARRLVAERGLTDIAVSSAGTNAWEGASASDGSLLVALEHGLDLAGHRARVLSSSLVCSTAADASQPGFRRLRSQGRAWSPCVHVQFSCVVHRHATGGHMQGRDHGVER